MQALKKIKRSLLLAIILIVSFGSSFAQSKIGAVAPPFKNTIAFYPNSQFLKVQDLQLDIAPYQLKTAYLQPQYWPPAFNSPFADRVLTSFAALNRLNNSMMPFFCDLEFQMEKASGFPVKFRLGDIRYVDRLEGRIDSHVPAPTW